MMTNQYDIHGDSPGGGRALIALAVVCSLVSAAGADPFYLRYDPDETFPEQEGWSRNMYGPSSMIQRTIEDGVFRLDTRASASISDIYYVNDTALVPSEGETLRVEWRMRTVESDLSWYRSDVMLAIRNTTINQHAQLFIAPGFVSEEGTGTASDPEHLYQIAPSVYHDYIFTTADMGTYELYVDGVLAFNGTFTPYSWFPGPAVVWGDTFIGLASLSEWDFVEVAVVPEPTALTMIVVLGLTMVFTNMNEILHG
jgi:hypothetical protein